MMLLTPRVKFLIISLLISIVGVFYFLTIREGHTWASDFGLYLHHAKNLAQGSPYHAVGYIPNLAAPSIAPLTSPPMLPWILAPIYMLFGMDFVMFKAVIVVFFLLFLVVMFLAFKDDLPFSHLLSLTAVVGLNPYYWFFRDRILSEIPFMFFSFLSLLWIHRFYTANKLKGAQWLTPCLVGIFIYFASATRDVGIVLIPSLVAYDFYRSRKLTRFTLITIAVALIGIGTQVALLHSPVDYRPSLSLQPEIAWHNFNIYAYQLGVLWENGYSKIGQNILFVSMSALALVGFWTRAKKGLTIFEIYPFFYMIPHLFVGGGNINVRYMLPIVPLAIFYSFVGIKRVSFWLRPNFQKMTLLAMMTFILTSYIGQYSRMDTGPIIDYGIGKKEAVELFDYVKNQTPKESVFLFRKPRVLSLMTGVRAAYYHLPGESEDFGSYLQAMEQLGATHMIFGNIFERDQKYLKPIIEQNTRYFKKVYTNPEFTIYTIQYP